MVQNPGENIMSEARRRMDEETGQFGSLEKAQIYGSVSSFLFEIVNPQIAGDGLEPKLERTTRVMPKKKKKGHGISAHQTSKGHHLM